MHRAVCYRDSSGAVIPEASVTATNKATSIASTRTSNAEGSFEIPGLRVGQHDLLVTRPGFTSAAATDIAVTISGQQRIDLTMTVGEASTTVDVASGINLQVEAYTSERGQIITQYQTAAPPLVSRTYSDLIGLTTVDATGKLTGTANTDNYIADFLVPRLSSRP